MTTASVAARTDRRGSAVPTLSMVTTRFVELRRRRGLMIALSMVTVGLPTIFLSVRLLLHAIAPRTYGPAGGYDIYTGLTVGVLYTLGFLVAATLGATAGSVDLTEGMFRHLVVTGREYPGALNADRAVCGRIKRVSTVERGGMAVEASIRQAGHSGARP